MSLSDEDLSPDLAEPLAMTLDEYIRRKHIKDQIGIFEMRPKKQTNISKEELDAELELIDVNETSELTKVNGTIRPVKRNGKTGCGRFDRLSMTRGDDNSDEENVNLDSDVEMEDDTVEQNKSIKNYDELEKLEHPECCNYNFKKFKTIESELGIRVRSQQWRVLPENLIDKPPGVQRLVTLPFDEEERYKKKVRNGKVNKQYRSGNTSFSSNLSKKNTKIGSFIEKGSFTFKFGNRNGNNSQEEVIGIERLRRTNQNAVSENCAATTSSQAPVNINMNWDGFFTGFEKCTQQPLRPIAPNTSDDSQEIEIAAKGVLAFLREARAKEAANMHNVANNAEDIHRSFIDDSDNSFTANTCNDIFSGIKPQPTSKKFHFA